MPATSTASVSQGNIQRTDELAWDRFHDKSIDVALPGIYREAVQASLRTRHWYWRSIRSKKYCSLTSRVFSYTLGIVGVAAPLVAATFVDAATKLAWTQAGVTALALAGLVQLGDTVFGWSGGWLRYTTTVTALEQLAMQFELDWATYLVARAGRLDASDLKPLFELARALQVETEKQRSDETKAWVAEFNAGMAALNETLKAQKEATQKAADSARAVNEELAKPRKNGALQVNIAQAQPPKPVTVFVDADEKATFTGTSWAMLDVEPGLHSVRVVADLGKPTALEASSAVDVPSGATALVAVKLA